MKVFISIIVFLITLTFTIQIIELIAGKKPVIRGRYVPGSALRTEPRDFPYPGYTDKIRASIAAHWKVPEIRQKAKTAIVFDINRNGAVAEEKIKTAESSGNQLFNQSAVKAIIESSPFPPLPEEFKEKSVRIFFEFLCNEE